MSWLWICFKKSTTLTPTYFATDLKKKVFPSYIKKSLLPENFESWCPFFLRIIRPTVKKSAQSDLWLSLDVKKNTQKLSKIAKTNFWPSLGIFFYVTTQVWVRLSWFFHCWSNNFKEQMDMCQKFLIIVISWCNFFLF